jgi:hypothetical protein
MRRRDVGLLLLSCSVACGCVSALVNDEYGLAHMLRLPPGLNQMGSPESMVL